MDTEQQNNEQSPQQILAQVKQARDGTGRPLDTIDQVLRLMRFDLEDLRYVMQEDTSLEEYLRHLSERIDWYLTRD